jgi:hypothetical protein
VTDAFYDKGDFLPVFTILGTPEVVYQGGGGYLSVPQTDFSGRCNDYAYAEFENDVSLKPCSRSWPSILTGFADQCQSGTASVDYYGKNVFGLATP